MESPDDDNLSNEEMNEAIWAVVAALKACRLAPVPATAFGCLVAGVVMFRDNNSDSVDAIIEMVREAYAKAAPIAVPLCEKHARERLD